MAVRADYMITNRVNVKKHKSIIREDLKHINTKFVMIFNENFNIEHTLESSIENNSYIDGFDIAFDIIEFK